jgi:hypothetical protein
MDEISLLSKAMSQSIVAENAAGWLNNAAVKGMLSGAVGTGTAAALSALGINNPMAQSAINSAVNAAAAAAGLGSVGSALGSLLSGGSGGLAGDLAGLMSSGGFAGGLNQAAGALGGMVVKDEIPKSALDGFDPSAVGGQAIDQAAGALMAQWKVDDDASAGEQVAHKMVADNMSNVTDAAKQAVLGDGNVLDSLKKKIDAVFNGATSKAADFVARMGDKDVKPPYIIQVGVATILAEGKPISRITDPLTPSGPVILEGSPTVLSAGLPTAHLKSATSPPAMMIAEGAPTVLVFVPPPPVAPPTKAPDAKNKSNEGPKKADAPKKSGSGSGSSGDSGQGNTEEGKAGDSTPGSTDPKPEAEGPQCKPEPPGTEEGPMCKPGDQPLDGMLGGPNAEIRSVPLPGTEIGPADPESTPPDLLNTNIPSNLSSGASALDKGLNAMEKVPGVAKYIPGVGWVLNGAVVAEGVGNAVSDPDHAAEHVGGALGNVGGSAGGAALGGLGAAATCAIITSETGIGPVLCVGGWVLGGSILGSTVGDAGGRAGGRAIDNARK